MARLARLFAIDLRSLAAFRIGLAIASIYALSVIAPDLAAFYTDDGLVPRAWGTPHQRDGGLSILMLSGDLWLVWLLWGVGLVASLALLAGWRGRIAAAVLWLVWLSFTSRNTFVVQGGDRLIAHLLFWAMFLPITARFSVDHALRRRDDDLPAQVLSVATVGLLLQVLYVYVFGALMKTSPIWIEHFSAIYLALHLDTFVTGAGVILREFGPIMLLLTGFVYLLELWSPLFLFFPDRRQLVRKVTLALLVAMHVGFRVFLHIGHFWMVSLSSLMSYVPGDFWDWLSRRVWRAEVHRMEIWYDRDCGFCLKVALLLREAFLPGTVPVRPAQDHAEIGALLASEVSWVVVDGTGRRWLHWDAVALVMRANALLRPLGWIAAGIGAIGVGRPLYDAIGRNRHSLGALTRWLSPPARLSVRLPSLLSALLAVVIVLVFGWNLRQVAPQVMPPFPAPLEAGMRFIGLNQQWGMFAPSPPTDDAIPIVTALGQGQEGRNLFLIPPGATPDNWYQAFPSHRWRKYINNLRILPEDVRRGYLAIYAVHACKVTAEAGQPAEAIQIEMLRRRTLTGYERAAFRDDWGIWPCQQVQ